MSEPAVLSPADRGNRGTKPERRAVVRYPCGREASCSSPEPFERRCVTVRDISTQGIAFVLDTLISRGTEIAVELAAGKPGAPLTLLAQVVYSTMQEDGDWIVGCDFLTKPREEQVRALL